MEERPGGRVHRIVLAAGIMAILACTNATGQTRADATAEAMVLKFTAEVDAALMAEIGEEPRLGQVSWGDGVFGAFGGAALDGKTEQGVAPVE